MGGVVVRKGIYDAFMRGPEHVIELFHGYTYSAHPLACAASLAAMDVYRDEDLFGHVLRLEPVWAEAIHSLRGLPNVLDIRTVGLVAAIDLASRPDAVGARAYEAMDRCFREHDLMVRHHRRHDRADAAADHLGDADRRCRGQAEAAAVDAALIKGFERAGPFAGVRGRAPRRRRNSFRGSAPSPAKGRGLWKPIDPGS